MHGKQVLQVAVQVAALPKSAVFFPVIVLLFLLLSLIAIFHQFTFALQVQRCTASGGSFFLMTVWLRCPEKKTMRLLPGEDMFGEAMSSEALSGAGGVDNQPEETPVKSPAAKAGRF